MENLSIKQTTTKIIPNLIRIGDLVNFEGPLLSLFKDARNGHLYLFDWVDRDAKFNRWLVYRVTPQALQYFIGNNISHFELLNSNPDKNFYITDIENKYRISDYDLLLLNDLPSAYLPNKDSFFTRADCTSFEKIQAIIIRELITQKQYNAYVIAEKFESSFSFTAVRKTKFVNNTIADSRFYLGSKIYNQVGKTINEKSTFVNRYNKNVKKVSNAGSLNIKLNLIKKHA